MSAREFMGFFISEWTSASEHEVPCIAFMEATLWGLFILPAYGALVTVVSLLELACAVRLRHC